MKLVAVAMVLLGGGCLREVDAGFTSRFRDPAPEFMLHLGLSEI